MNILETSKILNLPPSRKILNYSASGFKYNHTLPPTQRMIPKGYIESMLVFSFKQISLAFCVHFCIYPPYKDKLYAMKTHQTIDDRGLTLAQRIVHKIDADPERNGLKHARAVCCRWLQSIPSPAYQEWDMILSREWASIRTILLDTSDEGKRLRQNSPFCGILTPEERLSVFRSFPNE